MAITIAKRKLAGKVGLNEPIMYYQTEDFFEKEVSEIEKYLNELAN